MRDPSETVRYFRKRYILIMKQSLYIVNVLQLGILRCEGTQFLHLTVD